MRLGFFSLPTTAAAEAVMRDLAAQMAAEGLALAGALQTSTGPADCACDMEMAVLGDPGPALRISQSLGAGSSGCRLDAGALETVVARVGARLAAGADLLLLAKFGRQEAAGRGFAPLIGEALAAGTPVLLHVAPELAPAFAAFAGDLAEPVAPDALAGWCRGAARQVA